MINEDGLNLIKKWEGLVLNAYPDPYSPLGSMCHNIGITLQDYKKIMSYPHYDGNPWTIGYGETLNIKPGMTITEEQACKVLIYRTNILEDQIRPMRKDFTDNQVSALVSMAYNLGAGIIKNLILLNNLQDIPAKMLMYCHVHGKFVQGLKNRRKDEAALFLKKPLENS